MGQEISTLKDLVAGFQKSKSYNVARWRTQPLFDVARAIFALRKKTGWTQSALAKEAGTQQNRISRIESADVDFRISSLISVAEALKAHVEIRIVENTEESGYQPIAQEIVAVSKPSTAKISATVQQFDGTE